ncbi:MULTISPECIES: YtxH domain-containing protein [Flavobacteriaceae]|jgi:hypothetical protein|uniref:YtxH domain-containing protein n=1 Tax=Flavobacteriaceae TaxID=49546 RepID=UPI0013DF3EEE|nr:MULTISPECIES: YtxH domain-containing protein [Allomuricauda]MBO6829513.1 YtxH domain-containing protein [Allomuricauda sp.]NYJ26710.1 putative membrane protein [Muricauda sp. ARW1Y1]
MSEEKKDFGDKAEEAAKDFKEDVNKAFDPANPESGKTVAIIAHLTFIGWIIAIIMNSSNKTEIGSFYIRQTLGIFLLLIVTSFIPLINLVGWLLGVVLWIVSLIGSINGNQKPVFLVGEYFQNWFKSL